MNNLRRFVPALMLGLTIAMAGVAFAQSPNRAGADKQASCCMSGGCCGDSCHMTKGEMKSHATSSDKKSCCGCCGESCSMMKQDAMNGQSSSKHACCCGDSCQMKAGTLKNHVTASDKHACCCCGDSCEMKDGTKASTTAVKNGSSAGHECCGGDSCNMKNLKDKKEKP